MGFEHIGRSSKGFFGQRSPKVLQGYQGSLRVESNKFANSHKLFNF